MDRPEAYPTKRNRPRCLATSRPGGFRGKEDGRSHLEAQADHGDKIMEDFAVFYTAARRGDDLCGELGDGVRSEGSEERRTADHISKPRPTMGTKSWRILPYFILLLGGVMICVGNWVT